MVIKVKEKKKPKIANEKEGQLKKRELKPTNGKVDAQDLVNYIMSLVNDKIESILLPLKRDMEDMKIEIKRGRMRIKEVELEFQSLGMAIGELGIAEITILNDAKNKIRNKIGAADMHGNIRGRNTIRRFNLKPSSDRVLIQRKENE